MKSNGALARGRARMEEQGNFVPADAVVLLAAGKDPEFDPVHNGTDARIQKFLCGSYGQRWRDATEFAEPWTVEERHEIETAEVVVRDKRATYDAAIDARFEAERLYMSPDARTTPAQLVQLAREQRAAVEAQRLATEDLEKAIAVVTALKMQAQDRRRFEAQQQ